MSLKKFYFAGAGSPPYWYLILEAAGRDPLRAQQIEEQVSRVWWERWLMDREERLKAQRLREKTEGR